MKKDIYMGITVLIGDGKTPDSSGDVIDMKGVDFNKMVPVLDTFQPNDHLGFAELKKSGKKLVADIILYDPIECGVVTPAVGGKILKSRKLKSGVNKIYKCKISALSLQVANNADPRIKKLGKK